MSDSENENVSDGENQVLSEGENQVLPEDELELLSETAKSAIKITFVTSKNILLPLSMRPQPPPGFWTSPAAEEYASLAQPFHLLQGLTDIFKTVLGSETVLCLQTKFGNLRQVVERSSPQTQCNNVIGDPSHCWICGGGISTDNDDLGPECEHVFPIAQALVFTGLYEHSLFQQISDQEATDLPDAYISGLVKEYKWAHRICNQVKNDAHFIEFDGTNFVINEGLIQNFINDLITTRNWGGGNMLCAYLGRRNRAEGEKMLRRRVAAIRDACTPIIDMVSSLGLGPIVHAKSTAMFLKQYIASDPDCGIVEEVARTNPTVAGIAGYPIISRDYLNKVITDTTYLNDFSNDLFGRYTQMLQGLMGRGGAVPINAVGRTNILASLVDMETVYKQQIKTQIFAKIPNLRKQLMIYLQRSGLTGQVLGSNFDKLSSQVTLLILAKIICDGFVPSLKAQIENHTGIQSFPSLAPAMIQLLYSPEIINLIDSTLGAKAALIFPILFNTREEPPREEKIRRVLNRIEEISNIQPRPSNAPFPSFFKQGGTRRSKLNRNKKRYNSKSKNKKTRSQRRPKTF
jgi:hypothetical protein